jgi:hypothetical protein
MPYLPFPEQTPAAGAPCELNGRWPARLSLIGLALAAMVLYTGCASVPSRDYGALYRSGLYQDAAQSVIAESGLGEGLKEKKLLSYLYTGSAFLAGRSFEEAIAHFDHAERIMNEQDLAIVNRTIGNIGAGIMNDNVMAYRRREYDGIMVNGYKALCFLALDQPDLARVELLRADERQRRAVDRFAKLIEQNEEELRNERSSNAEARTDAVIGNPHNEAQLGAMLAELSAWGSYADFVNPFVTYLHGLFFLTRGENQSDFERALESLKRVYGMTRNKVVEEDLILARKTAGGGAEGPRPEDFVWVVYENGMGPRKEESRFDLIVPYKRITYVGVAVPRLVRGASAYPRLDIRENGSLLGSTAVVCDMEAVVAAEFKQELPMIYMRAATSTLIKTFIQYAASREVEKEHGPLAGLLTSIALGAIQAATTQADVRIWESLPKNFQIVRVARPPSGQLEIHVPGGVQPVAVVEVAGGSIIWVKVPVAGGTPLVAVLGSAEDGPVKYPATGYATTN